VQNIPFLSFVCGVAILVFNSCAPSREQVWMKSRDPKQNRTAQWSKFCTPYAKMSFLAYGAAPVPSLETVQSKDDDRTLAYQFSQSLEMDGWSLVEKELSTTKGLHFDIWKRNAGNRKEYVIAFRGTEATDPADWLANFRWFRWARYTAADQYTNARIESKNELRKLISEAEIHNSRVVTTGHSLGGGIAQGVFYSDTDYIDQAVVFDTSPVTGFLELDRDTRDKYKSLPYRETFPRDRVVRVYQRGEILQYVRNFTQTFYRPHPLVHEVEFDMAFGSGFITKHNMGLLAKEIEKKANESGGAASAPAKQLIAGDD